jgi:hypothetical protein
MKAAVDYWIFREYAPATGGLPLYRIIFAVLILIFCVPEPTVFATLPASFYSPQVGLAALFSGFPPRWFCEVLNLLLVLGAVCLLFGYRVRLVCVAMALVYVILKSFAYAIGKVDGDILIVATLLCFAWSGWGGRYSMDAVRLGRLPRHRDPAWPLCLLMLVIGLCFFTAFYSKAKSGWLDPRLECCHGQLLLNALGAERPSRVADAIFGIHQHLFWKALDYGTVAMEGAFLWCSARLMAMRFVTAAACFFHAGIYFSMDIFFWANLIVYLSLVDGRIVLRRRLGRRLLRGWMAMVRGMGVSHLLVAAMAVRLLYFAVGYGWRSQPVFLDAMAVLTLAAGMAGLGWFFGAIGVDRRGRKRLHPPEGP